MKCIHCVLAASAVFCASKNMTLTTLSATHCDWSENAYLPVLVCVIVLVLKPAACQTVFARSRTTSHLIFLDLRSIHQLISVLDKCVNAMSVTWRVSIPLDCFVVNRPNYLHSKSPIPISHLLGKVTTQ